MKDTIMFILEHEDRTRDSDPLLYILVARKLNIKYKNTFDLLTKLDYTSVCRTRRLLQSENAELRGITYKKRQIKGNKKREKYGFRSGFKRRLFI